MHNLTSMLVVTNIMCQQTREQADVVRSPNMVLQLQNPKLAFFLLTCAWFIIIFLRPGKTGSIIIDLVSTIHEYYMHEPTVNNIQEMPYSLRVALWSVVKYIK